MNIKRKVVSQTGSEDTDLISHPKIFSQCACVLSHISCVQLFKCQSFSHDSLFTTCVDCSPRGSSVHKILQARILEWVACPFSKGSSRPRDGTQVSCIAGRFFTIWATEEPLRRSVLFPTLMSGKSRNSHPLNIWLKLKPQFHYHLLSFRIK